MEIFNLNFDDAPKGKSRRRVLGGCFRNDRGVILYIYVDNIGVENNNFI